MDRSGHALYCRFHFVRSLHAQNRNVGGRRALHHSGTYGWSHASSGVSSIYCTRLGCITSPNRERCCKNSFSQWSDGRVNVLVHSISRPEENRKSSGGTNCGSVASHITALLVAGDHCRRVHHEHCNSVSLPSVDARGSRTKRYASLDSSRARLWYWISQSLAPSHLGKPRRVRLRHWGKE